CFLGTSHTKTPRGIMGRIPLYKVCSTLFGLYKDNKGTEKEIERLTREIELAERKRSLDNKLNHK
ncbi:hypothetical protein, partial [Vibrio aestuarianus]|uniref:hypothetical protein n=1 Tax=Vibrio aestuarianus TaxID=28171 RepID=UPI00237C7BFF